ncbi:MAG: protein TolR [Nevskia sp.]
MSKKRMTALGGDEEMGPVAEINITPMVDVMLVLLIIFMVTAPLMMSQLPVTLPKASAAPSDHPKDPLIVSVDLAGHYYIDQDRKIGPVEVSTEQLQPTLIEIAKQDPDNLVYVSGDQKINYGKVVDLIGVVGNSGFAKVSLQSKQAYADGTPSTR